MCLKKYFSIKTRGRNPENWRSDKPPQKLRQRADLNKQAKKDNGFKRIRIS